MNHNIGNLISKVQHGIIVHGCNAQGVMGAGIAKEIRDTFPKAYEAYVKAHREKGLKVGQVIWHVEVDEGKGQRRLAVANAITQEFYGGDKGRCYLSYEGLEFAMKKIAQVAKEQDLPVHYPLIGAGLAGGDWERIQDIMQRSFRGVEHTVWTLPGFPVPDALKRLQAPSLPPTKPCRTL